MATVSTGRIVPGAPPPAPLTKTQKKKRRAVKKEGDTEPDTPAATTLVLPDAHAAALTEKAPEEKDMKSGAVADELVAKPEAPKSEVGDTGPKGSPVVELLNKRLKAIGKKITRIHTYSSKPQSELNDDQKKSLATLPSLEAVRKELEEAKKAVETLEAEQVKEAAAARAVAEEASRRKIAEAVAEAQRAHIERTAQILDIIRFQSLLSNADATVQSLDLVQVEINAVHAAVNALLAQEAETKHAVLQRFLHEEGDVEGVSIGRFLEILEILSRPTIQEEIAIEAEQVAEAVSNALAGTEVQNTEQVPLGNGVSSAVSGIPTTGGILNFGFMQESELENDPDSSENGAEWVEKAEVRREPVEAGIPAEIKETYPNDEPHPAEQQAENGALSWADDEGELPSIDGLHATFGTSGSGTPANDAIPAEQPEREKEQSQATAPTEAAPNGTAQPNASDDDGFMQARASHARGRGRGFRGGERGSYRGDRGGFRGGRGGRGRPYQGSDAGNWRQPQEGEQRGRGRGRGRGGFDRERGGYRGGRGRGGTGDGTGRGNSE